MALIDFMDYERDTLPDSYFHRKSPQLPFEIVLNTLLNRLIKAVKCLLKKSKMYQHTELNKNDTFQRTWKAGLFWMLNQGE